VLQEPRARAGGAVVVLGLSHHTASVDVRERLAVKEDDWQDAAASLTALPDVAEAAVLSTCNRFEVYLFADHGFNAITHVVSHLAETSGIPVPELRRHLFMLTGNEASWHLLRVSAGLDSLVIGEGQILSQVKRCYELATEKNGQAGKVLARLLNTAVSAGKRVRSETAIAKGAVSISSAAVELAEMRAVRDVDMGISDARVCILGAGKMSRLLVQHLVSRGVRSITIVNRSMERAVELTKMFPDNHIEIVLVDGMMSAVSRCDICFASTSATEPIVTRENMSAALDVGHKCMLIDISVPRNVATDVGDIPDVTSYNVDDLKAVVAKNQARRRRLMLEAETLLCEEQTSFNNWHHSLCCVPAISKLQQRAEAIRQEELERVKGKLSGLSSAEMKAVETLSRGIINKMLHSPMTHLRGLEDVEERSQTLEAIEALFRL
jgi:glutamyl-tRNA reductase